LLPTDIARTVRLFDGGYFMALDPGSYVATTDAFQIFDKD
jgi:hypothetical protein